MQMLAFVLARLSEPSSYAGLGAILALVGVDFSDSDLGQLAQFFAAGCGLAALLLKERGVIQTIALVVLIGAGLGACAGPDLPKSAILTKTQQAMCEAQSAANLAGAIAAVAGDASAVADASKASAAAGTGCSWTDPDAAP